MNDLLIKTAKSRAHRVIQDDKVLRRARAVNRVSCTGNPILRAVELLPKSYAVITRDCTGCHAIHTTKTIYTTSLRLARQIGRELCQRQNLIYVTTRLTRP